MKALADHAQTLEARVRKAIARNLDEALITSRGTPNDFRLNTAAARDMDDLVEKIAASVLSTVAEVQTAAPAAPRA